MQISLRAAISLFFPIILLCLPVFAAASTFPQLVNVASDGTPGNAPASIPSLSADGRYIVFASGATNLVPGDTNGLQDIFVHDMVTGSTMLASVASDGAQGDGHSSYSAISSDGRYIAFNSAATNLVPNDTNGLMDIFAHDMVTGSTTRVSVATDGTEGNNNSSKPYITSNGRFVIFTSNATNLIPGITTGSGDIFVHDMLTGSTSLALDGAAVGGAQRDGGTWYPTISSDGRYIAFVSNATNLVPDDTNGTNDIFVYDMIMGFTTRVSVATDGTEGNSQSSYPYISFNGRYVTFKSWASNLVPNDTNGLQDIFVHDMVTGSTTLASVASDGTQENNFPQQGIMSTLFPSTISDDGQFVMFHSWATNLVPDDTNDNMDIFVHDTITGQTARVSLATDGAQANRSSLNGVISADGRYVTFFSEASNLIAGYNYPYRGVYFARNPLFDGITETGTNVSVTPFTTDGADNQIAPSPVSLTFSDVTGSGITSTQVTSGGMPPPTGFKSGTPPTYYNISTTATFTGSVEVCIDYSGVTFHGPEANLTLQHLDSATGLWANITTSQDTTTRIICGLTTSFSEFAIFEPDNEAPVLASIGNKTVAEGATLSFTLDATDVDGNTLTYSTANLPAGASFDPQTCTFTWTPTYEQAGNYPDVEFTVSDDGSPMMLDTELITITVGDVNRAPVFDLVGSQTVDEGQPLTFTVNATDPDGNSEVYSATGLPTGAQFVRTRSSSRGRRTMRRQGITP